MFHPSQRILIKSPMYYSLYIVLQILWSITFPNRIAMWNYFLSYFNYITVFGNSVNIFSILVLYTIIADSTYIIISNKTSLSTFSIFIVVNFLEKRCISCNKTTRAYRSPVIILPLVAIILCGSVV